MKKLITLAIVLALASPAAFAHEQSGTVTPAKELIKKSPLKAEKHARKHDGSYDGKHDGKHHGKHHGKHKDKRVKKRDNGLRDNE